MYTKSWVRGVVVIGLVVALAGPGMAAVRDQSRMSDQPSTMRQQSDQQSTSIMRESQIRRVDQMIGKPVKNAQGEKLGTIHDLVLTPELDQVSYVALSRGGFLGIGQHLYAIPWSSIRVGPTGAYISSISTNDLSRERAFSSAAWPSEPTQGFMGTTARTAEERQTAREKKEIQNRRVSRIKGTTVETPEGVKTGHIRDLAVATDSGRVQYTIVTVGGTMGLGTKLAAVPQGAINLEPDRRVAQLNVGRDILRSNTFVAGRYPDLSDPSYARQINRAYGVGTGETVLGYVPAEEPKQNATTPSTGTRSGTDRTPKSTSPDNKMQRESTAGKMSSLKIDPQAKFDPAAVKTVEGVVTAVGKSVHAGTAEEILLLQIKTDSGDLITVHAGPLKYVSKQDFYAVDGDRISVTGSPVRGSDNSELLAARISKDGQVLTLRDRDGQPVWDRSSDRAPQSGAESRASGQHMEGSSSEGASGQTDETPTP